MIKNIKIKNSNNIRLDKFLKSLFTSLNQSFIEKNIRKKNILINNLRTKANYLVKSNDILKILNFHEELYKNKIVIKKNLKIPLEFMKKFNRSVIFQDKNFLVINKWSQIATQGGSKINISIDDIIRKIDLNYRLVHRLDKETSGLLIIAKNLEYAKIFNTLFKEKNITKLYLALVEGNPKNDHSKVILKIKNNKNKLQNTFTNYKVLSNKNGISQILFNPKTGKTHQLRIVSKNLGTPIIGDKKYNNYSNFKNENLMLHSYCLKFKINDKLYEFISEIPEYFIKFIKINKLQKPKEIKNYLKIF